MTLRPRFPLLLVLGVLGCVMCAPRAASADTAPAGQILVVSPNTVEGWACDPDSTGQVDIHIWVVDGSGTRFLTWGRAYNDPKSGDDPSHLCLGSPHRFKIAFGLIGSGTLYVSAINIHNDTNPPASNTLLGTASASNAIYFSNVGVGVAYTDPDPVHWKDPVRVDLFVLDDNNVPRWHNRCYTNGHQETFDDANAFTQARLRGVAMLDYQTFCLYKYPLTVSGSAGKVTVRLSKRAADGSYREDWQNTSSYVDVTNASNVTLDAEYSAQGRTVTLQPAVSSPLYSAKIDLNGGAIYEFANQTAADSSLPSGKYENIIHAHMGAALQTAVHSGIPGSLTSDACGGFGYFNPNQSGAACAYPYAGVAHPSPEFGVDVTGSCNGGSCTAGNTYASAQWNSHRVMNWDYGPSYQGPYHLDIDPNHNSDSAFLAQAVSATEHYLQVNVTWNNTGNVSRPGAFQAPGFFVSNRFRHYAYPNPADAGATVVDYNLPSASGYNDVNNAFFTTNSDVVNWMTLENTFTSTANRWITVAWFYRPSVYNSTDPGICGNNGKWRADISENDLYDTVVISTAPCITFGPSQTLEVRYVLFPHKYDETIPSPFGGTATVKSIIATMKANYLNNSW